MKCNEAGEFVSRLCDGQVIPPEAAEHVGACGECRTRLDEYLRMGAELRRVASLEQPGMVKGSFWKSKAKVQRVWWRRGATMRIPRFAFVSMLSVILLLSGGLVLGQYLNHQPVRWGWGTTPATEAMAPKDEFAVVDPVLIRGKQVVCDLSSNGFSIDDGDADATLMIYYPGEGRYLISRVPFSGAVEGSAKMGQVRFALDGENYLLLSGMPIISSDHVWVSHDPQYKLSEHLEGASDDQPWFHVRSLKMFLQPELGHIN